MFRKINTTGALVLILFFNTMPANGAGYSGPGYNYYPQYYGTNILPSRLGSMHPLSYRRPAFNFYRPQRPYYRSRWGHMPAQYAAPALRRPWYGMSHYSRYKQGNPAHKPFQNKAPLIRKAPELQAQRFRYRGYHRTAYTPRWQMQRVRYYPKPKYRAFTPRKNYRHLPESMMANRLPIPRS